MDAFSGRLKGCSVLFDASKEGFFFRFISCMALVFRTYSARRSTYLEE